MSDSGSDHEHWPEDFDMRNESAVPAEGYDSHNGLRSQIYVPAVKEATPPASPRSLHAGPQLEHSLTYMPYQYHPHTSPYAAHFVPPQGGYYQYVPAPTAPAAPAAPAVPTAPTPVTAVSAIKEGLSYTYQPAGATDGIAAMAPNVWLGRTKVEVEEDNKKIAAAEKVYDKRTMVPTGLPDDQMCWVVETDKSHTLRPFVAIKDLKGGWNRDPRYEDSWFFVIEKEKKADKEGKKK
ncbi:hypothetical protein B0A48_01004 [Cryoendolithus antarcticus]|uniref:Uncharacterized protein n=1 Tax=Cryoendolithus antarcticus TaxID=1507870 RepID=A0A1V8TS30_9PEZI|nr:hypothetical protein B0A48_01004 [Cryoendolithus antarcticus]